MTERPTIAFLGLGNMGRPMASNLRAAGYTVRGYDPSPVAADGARDAGIDVANDPGEATAGAGVVITMLPSGRHVLDAYLPGTGVIDRVPAGSLLIDCSTIDVGDAREAHATAKRAGLQAVDAPVSGGVVGASAASLTFMVGGDADTFDRVQPILTAMGTRIVHCGGPGAGQAAKICNNLVAGASMAAISEAFVLAESLGLGNQALFDVMSTSSAQCWALTTNCPVPGPVPSSPANRDYSGGFATALMLKDLRLANAAAEQHGVDLALGRQALAMFTELAGVHPDRDFSILIDAIRDRSVPEAARQGPYSDAS